MINNVIALVVSYLAGSVNFSIVFSKLLLKQDIRTKGSGNAGFTNTLRNYGKVYGAAVFLCDILKTVAVILAARFILKERVAEYCAAVGVILGHNFPVFFGFKGGKGVATAGGMVFMIDWRIALILLAIFIITVAVTKYVSLGSIIMAVLYPVLIFVFYKSLPLTVISAVFTIIVVVAHRENIKKLINHTESKIGSKK